MKKLLKVKLPVDRDLCLVHQLAMAVLLTAESGGTEASLLERLCLAKFPSRMLFQFLLGLFVLVEAIRLGQISGILFALIVPLLTWNMAEDVA